MKLEEFYIEVCKWEVAPSWECSEAVEAGINLYQEHLDKLGNTATSPRPSKWVWMEWKTE